MVWPLLESAEIRDLTSMSLSVISLWSKQQHHLAGPLGTALADRLFALDWVRRTDRRRVVRVTDAGRENLPGTLGLPRDWDQPAEVSRPLTA